MFNLYSTKFNCSNSRLSRLSNSLEVFVIPGGWLFEYCDKVLTRGGVDLQQSSLGVI